MMIRQIISLAALAGILMTATAYMVLEPADIARRLVAVHGAARAAVLAQQGTGAAMMGLIPEQLMRGALYLVGGVAVGPAARLAGDR